MIVLKEGAASAVLPEKEAAIAGYGEHVSMTQQDQYDAHGHEMHPQQFVRLIGYRDPKAARRGAGQPLH
jgi:hypothetical protein